MYSLEQWRCVAREVARSGGVVDQAARNLRSNYETFGAIGATTIRRVLNKPFFQRLRQEQEEMLAKVRADTELLAEKARAAANTCDKNTVRQATAEAVRHLRELDPQSRDARSLRVLLEYLKFLSHV